MLRLARRRPRSVWAPAAGTGASSIPGAATGSAPTPPTSPMMADAASLLVGRMITAAMGWSGTVLIVRSLSKFSWGEFALVFNVMSLLFIITNAVGPRVALRSLFERDDQERFAGSYIVLRSLLGVVGYGIAVGFTVVASYPGVVIRAMALAGLVVIISSASNGYSIVFQMHQQLREVALGQVLGQTFQLAVTVVLAVVGSTMIGFTVPAVLCEVVILAWVHLRARRLLKVRFTVIASTWWSLFRTAIPVAVGQGLFALYANIDSVLLSKLQTFQAVGAYGIAYKFANLVAMIPMAMAAAIFGTLVRSWPEQPHVFWSAFRRSLLTLFVVSVLISTEFAVFARPIVTLLYGQGYVAVAGAARLVVLGACLSFFTVLTTAALTSQGRNVLYMLAGGIGLVANVVANLIVIPRWSYLGAAWVTVLTEAVVLAAILPVSLGRRYRQVLPFAAMAKTLVCGAVSTGAGVGLYLVGPWSLAAGVSTAIFIALVHFLRVPGAHGLRSLVSELPAEPSAPAEAASPVRG